VALVLARDRFPGKSLMSALINLPLAISPIVVGLMAILLFGTGGWFEPFFAAHGIKVLFALPSMVLVTIFISIPFVIRELVPTLEELGTEEEQAGWTLGASRLQTFFRVTLPNVKWGLAYGIALSSARAIGEVGAVLVVSGLLQGQTETATLYILRAFDQFHEDEGYVVALTLAAFSVLMLASIEAAKRLSTHRRRKKGTGQWPELSKSET
jgi:sulfate transport system permease protein